MKFFLFLLILINTSCIREKNIKIEKEIIELSRMNYGLGLEFFKRGNKQKALFFFNCVNYINFYSTYRDLSNYYIGEVYLINGEIDNSILAYMFFIKMFPNSLNIEDVYIKVIKNLFLSIIKNEKMFLKEGFFLNKLKIKKIRFFLNNYLLNFPKGRYAHCALLLLKIIDIKLFFYNFNKIVWKCKKIRLGLFFRKIGIINIFFLEKYIKNMSRIYIFNMIYIDKLNIPRAGFEPA